MTTAQDISRLPPREERLRELKIYYFVCPDATKNAQELLSAIGHATLGLQHAARNDPRFTAYIESSLLRPKITLRARNLDAVIKAGKECAQAGIPYSFASVANATDVLCFGPLLREELPPFIARQQLLVSDSPPCLNLEPHDDRPSLRLMVRQDVVMPSGKLVVQAGHALFDVMLRMRKEMPDDFTNWLLDGCPIDIRPTIGTVELQAAHRQAAETGMLSALVVDQGRTVFGDLTMTAGGFYPLCPDKGFPEYR